MSKNRDDFTKTTINRAAARVGYRCSYPGCPNATIGASMESNDSISTLGVGAHICAAAKGGPRYDENMTIDERRGIDNCIWLCQTHAKLIDTDVETYTVEVIKGWKKEAEKNASLALADTNYFDEYYRNNGENLFALEGIFNGLLVEGDYKTLTVMLNQYHSSFTEVYDELVLRFNIIYDVYCNRNKLAADLTEYLNLKVKTGVDQIIEVFVSFLMQSELSLILSFAVNPKLKELAELTIEEKLISQLIKPIEDAEPFEIAAEHESLFNKTISYIAFDKKLYSLLNDKKENIAISNEEFYYKIIFNVYSAVRNVVVLSSDYQKELDYIQQNFDKINQLDIELQIPIFERLLNISINNPDNYNAIYSHCPSKAKSVNSIVALNNLFDVINNFESIDMESLLQSSVETNNFWALSEYVSKLTPQKQELFLDEHQFLYSKDSTFIYRKHLLSKDNTDLKVLIERYKDKNKKDFLFHCVAAFYSEDTEGELQWLKSNWDLVQGQHLPAYLDTLVKFEKYDDLYQLSLLLKDKDIKYKIACWLQNSSETKHIEQCKSIYLELISEGFSSRGLHHNLAVINWSLGEVENALEHFQKEYDSYPDVQSLKGLLNLRHQTNRFIDDSYFKNAKASTDASIQNLVGSTLMRLNRKNEAAIHFLRSLLIDDNNPYCLRGLYAAYSELDDNEPDMVDSNTVCELRNGNESVKVAIHKAETLENIQANSFAECIHFSEYDEKTANLIYAKQGDVVSVFGCDYTVEKITSLNSYVSSFAFADIIKDPSTRKIEGIDADDFIENITNILREEQAKRQDVIDEYNTSPLRLPLPYLSNVFGKSQLNTCEFLLFGNKAKIRNNTNDISSEENDVTYILSYDSIVILAHLDMLEELKNLNYVCPTQVKEQLLSDINGEISDIKNKRQVGSMSYSNDKLTLFEHNQQSRQSRYQFLIRIRSFLENAKCENSSDFHSDKFDFGEFVKHNFFCENSSLAMLQSIKNSVLVSDEQFLYSIANLEELATVGICHILTQCNYTWEELLQKIKTLSQMNFSYYFPPNLYNLIVELIYADEERVAEGEVALSQWLLYDLDDEQTSEHHRQVIIQLIRDLATIDPSFRDLQTPLHKIAVHHFASLYPKETNKIICNAFSNLKDNISNIEIED